MMGVPLLVVENESMLFGRVLSFSELKDPVEPRA
jgi:hypothetical protein